MKESLFRTLACTLAVALSATAHAGTLSYNFDDGTLDGWVNTKTSNPAVWSGPSQFIARPNDPGNGSMDYAPRSVSGNYSVQENVINNFDYPFQQDMNHQTLVLTSPSFTLAKTGSISFYLVGGTGSGNLVKNYNQLPATTIYDNGNPSRGGFLGVGLRDLSTGNYLLSAHVNQIPATYDPAYELHTFSNAQLSALGILGNSKSYVLDLIDYNSGSWGSLGMDSVTISGARPTPEPSSLALVVLGSATVGGYLRWRRRKQVGAHPATY